MEHTSWEQVVRGIQTNIDFKLINSDTLILTFTPSDPDKKEIKFECKTSVNFDGKILQTIFQICADNGDNSHVALKFNDDETTVMFDLTYDGVTKQAFIEECILKIALNMLGWK
jgi:hypothetical protein